MTFNEHCVSVAIDRLMRRRRGLERGRFKISILATYCMFTKTIKWPETVEILRQIVFSRRDSFTSRT